MEHTKGPWKWEINLNTKKVMLYADDDMKNYVMQFGRYGMNGAAPLFNVDGIMRRCDRLTEVEKGREHHKDWHQLISHPDAQLIACAPTLLEENKKLKEVIQSALNIKDLWLPPENGSEEHLAEYQSLQSMLNSFKEALTGEELTLTTT